LVTCHSELGVLLYHGSRKNASARRKWELCKMRKNASARRKWELCKMMRTLNNLIRMLKTSFSSSTALSHFRKHFWRMSRFYNLHICTVVHIQYSICGSLSRNLILKYVEYHKLRILYRTKTQSSSYILHSVSPREPRVSTETYFLRSSLWY
jgi:hypothetical protein